MVEPELGSVGKVSTRARASGWELQPFISGVSHFLAHDLSNAISALSITLDLLATQQDLPPKSRELVRRAISLEGRLHALADTLGALGGARMTPQPLALVEVLEATLNALKLRERFAVELDLRELKTSTVCSPAPNLIEFCLRRLLRNAADATPAAGRLGVQAASLPGAVRLTVWDEGEGVAPALREKLFCEVFSTKGERGVSLLLARAAAEGSLRGRLSFAPNQPRGSSFILELPT